MKITKSYLKQIIKEEFSSLEKRVIKEVVEVVPGLPKISDEIRYLIRSNSVFLYGINNSSGVWIVSFTFTKKFVFKDGTKVELKGICKVNIEEPSNPQFDITYINAPNKEESCIKALKNPEGKFYKEFINKDVLNYIVITNNIDSSEVRGKSKNAPIYLKSAKFEEWKSTKQ